MAYNIPLPHKHVYRKTRQIDRKLVQLEDYLIYMRLRALAHGDMACVDLVTGLLAERRLWHV
jgi:hypothetical protein